MPTALVIFATIMEAYLNDAGIRTWKRQGKIRRLHHCAGRTNSTMLIAAKKLCNKNPPYFSQKVGSMLDWSLAEENARRFNWIIELAQQRMIFVYFKLSRLPKPA